MAYIIVVLIIVSLAFIPSVQALIHRWLHMLDYVAREEAAEEEWKEITGEINELFDRPLFSDEIAALINE